MKVDSTEALLPGSDLVQQGLADLRENRETESLLVLIAAPACTRALTNGLAMLPTHYYNGLLRRIVSYAHALEREQAQ